MERAWFSVELFMCAPLIRHIWLRGTTRVFGVGVFGWLCVRILEDGVNILFVYLSDIFFGVIEKSMYLCMLGLLKLVLAIVLMSYSYPCHELLQI